MGQFIIQVRRRWREFDPGRRHLYEIDRFVRAWVGALHRGTDEEKHQAESLIDGIAPDEKGAIKALIDSLRIENSSVQMVVGRALNRLIGERGPHSKILVMTHRSADIEYFLYANGTWMSRSTDTAGSEAVE